VKKKMISLWKKQGKAGEGVGVILTRCITVRRLCPHPLLHYCKYVPLDCASGSVSITQGGERRGGAMMSAHLSTVAAKLRHLFNFHLLFYYMVEALSSTFNPRRLLQLQSLSPTSSLFNFSPPFQLHPSLPPTSTLVAFQFPDPVTVLFPTLLLDDACGTMLDAATAR
jgi:hypothetical protein